MAAVARQAGVGKATLSRRFATRDHLINAVFADRMDAYATAVTQALADPDPWHGFTGCIHAVCAMQAADRGFAEVLTMTFPAAKARGRPTCRSTRRCRRVRPGAGDVQILMQVDRPVAQGCGGLGVAYRRHGVDGACAGGEQQGASRAAHGAPAWPSSRHALARRQRHLRQPGRRSDGQAGGRGGAARMRAGRTSRVTVVGTGTAAPNR
ncbi:TetR/AcrR family transcriptional regulator [Streptomyces coeruleorubidus]